MNFFFDSNGKLLKNSPEFVYQGSNSANTVYFMAPFIETYQATVSFALPDGKVFQPIIMTSGGNIHGATDDNGQGFAVWFTSLTSQLTAVAGEITIQFAVYTTTQIVKTEAVKIKVMKGTPPVLPDTPEPDIYEEMLQVLNGIVSTDVLNEAIDEAKQELEAEMNAKHKILVGDGLY